MSLIGSGLGACSVRSWSMDRSSPALAPVRADWDRVIRTTVGLRPHRPSGFVLRADRLGETTVIHNYGHGGAGMSISWGTGQLAAEMALEHDSRAAAVIGCGVVGLTCARQLQRRGFGVTIYAMTVPPNTTSNMSLAGFTPTSGLVDGDLRTSAWDAQFREAAEISYRQLQLLVGRGYGVSWLRSYALSDREPRARQDSREPERTPLLPAQLRTGTTRLGPGEHPFPTRYATRRTQMRIEPTIYLEALVRDFVDFGGRIVIRKFTEPRELAALEESLVINCTGLGARDLFGDTELMPVKGQLTVLVPQPEVEYGTFGGARPSRGGLGIHMQPRSDGIVLGGTAERGEWSLEPDREAMEHIVTAHQALFSAMRG
uniref:D-amino-acid oxidase n=1 Tax=bacterium symbiont of Plakortis simplex pPS11G3 TaxID=1256902 RepID=V5JAJ2_UNCXX|nr:FAD dependent oxido reductase [bacterium symbiont of Plakortis simplex pPS11G3]